MSSARAGTGVTHCLTYNNKILCGNNRAADAVKMTDFDTTGDKKCARCEAKRAAMLAKRKA